MNNGGCTSDAKSRVAVLRRTMGGWGSQGQLKSLASVASPINNPSRYDSTLQRCDSSESWWRVSDSPVARQLPRLATSPAVLSEWPAVDDDEKIVASSRRHLLSFDLDPTTLPTDVLCHLALEMFVSA